MINEIINNIDLETELKVLNEMAFIDLLSELGYREDAFWTPEEDDKLHKLCDLAQNHTKNILQIVEQYNKK